MKKAQISFEFMVLFVILLFVFISIAYLFPGSIEKSSSTASTAENLARDIKVKAITASLSEADFESEMLLPDHVNNVEIEVLIYTGDDLVIVQDADTGRALAKAFLPKIDSITGSALGRKLMITKTKSGNQLIIDRSDP